MGTPALLAAQSGKALAALNQSSAFFYRAVDGAIVTDNATASVGWDVTLVVDVTAGCARGPGGAFDVAAATAQTLAPLSGANPLTVDADTYAAIIIDLSDGTLGAVWSGVWVPHGAGGEARVTDAQVDAAFGSPGWARACDVLVRSQATGTVSIVVDSAAARFPASGFNGDLAVTEAGFNAGL